MDVFQHASLEQIEQHQVRIRAEIDCEARNPKFLGFQSLAWLLAAVAPKFDPQIVISRDLRT